MPPASSISVRDFVVAAGKQLGMKIEWRGEGVDEVGVDSGTGRTLVRVDPRYFRPTEVETLVGDPTKARQKLGWSAEVQLRGTGRRNGRVRIWRSAKRDALVAKEGFKVYSHHE